MWPILAAAAGGLLVGSFANVVIHRVPARASILRPGSRCPSCDTPIRPRDNIPVLSWLLLKGRCRACRAPIGGRYPAVEILTAAVFALTAWRLDPIELIAFLPLMWVLVVLTFIDIDHKILPNRIVLPSAVAFLALLAIVVALDGTWADWLRAVGGGAAAFTTLLVVALIYPAGMGFGDVKLAIVLGSALGYLGWAVIYVGFFLSFLIGALGGLAMVLARRAGMKSQIPFGPYLALGSVVGVLWGSDIARAWLG